MNNQGSMQSGKGDGRGPENRPTLSAGGFAPFQGLPWLAIGGGLVAAVIVVLVVLAWMLGGPRQTTWVEQPVAVPSNASPAHSESKP